MDLTDQEINDTGLKEVSRIRNEMLSIIGTLKFPRNFDELLSFLRTISQFYAQSPNELLKFARDVSKGLDEQLPRYFITLPGKPYGVVKVPDAMHQNILEAVTWVLMPTVPNQFMYYTTIK